MAPPLSAYQMENFDPLPDEELICSICRCVFYDPVECPCRHVYCRTCISSWLSRRKTCPVCRKRASTSKLQTVVPIIKNMIMKLTIHCPNIEHGCKQKIALEAYDSHLTNCDYGIVQCKNANCKENCIRKDMPKHELKECKYRTVKCRQYCSLMVPVNLIKSHSCVEELKKELKDKLTHIEGAGKWTRSADAVSSSGDGRPAKRTLCFQPELYSEALTSLQMAIIKEGYPDSMIMANEVDLLLGKILSRVDCTPVGQPLPMLRSYTLDYGALIYTCINEFTCQWLTQLLDGYFLGKGIRLKVIPVKDLPKPVKVAFRTADSRTQDVNKLLARLKIFNPELKTENWRVVGRNKDAKGQRIIMMVDLASFKAIKAANFKAFTGIDRGTFKVLSDPNSKSGRPIISVIAPAKGHELVGLSDKDQDSGDAPGPSGIQILEGGMKVSPP